MRIVDQSSRESLAEYMARPPISLGRIRYEPLSAAEDEVDLEARKRGCARLLAKVYEVDPFVCANCGGQVKVIAIIEDPEETRRILRHLGKTRPLAAWIRRRPAQLTVSSRTFDAKVHPLHATDPIDNPHSIRPPLSSASSPVSERRKDPQRPGPAPPSGCFSAASAPDMVPWTCDSR